MIMNYLETFLFSLLVSKKVQLIQFLLVYKDGSRVVPISSSPFIMKVQLFEVQN